MLRLLRNGVGGRRPGEVVVPQTESKPTEASSFPAAQNPPGHVPHLLPPRACRITGGGWGWLGEAGAEEEVGVSPHRLALSWMW